MAATFYQPGLAFGQAWAGFPKEKNCMIVEAILTR
jgi:hypothetical protein